MLAARVKKKFRVFTFNRFDHATAKLPNEPTSQKRTLTKSTGAELNRAPVLYNEKLAPITFHEEKEHAP